jgi:subtilisin family serine protease
MLVIPTALVDLVLLGPADDRRQLQDSPVLGDVWVAYATAPGSTQDLLITPHKQATAGKAAHEISVQLGRLFPQRTESARIAYLQGIVAARLSLREMLRVLVPLTHWWTERDIATKLAAPDYTPTHVRDRLRQVFQSLLQNAVKSPDHDFGFLDRYVALVGLLLWASQDDVAIQPTPSGDPPKSDAIIQLALASLDDLTSVLVNLYEQITSNKTGEAAKELIFQVSLNRQVAPALERSVPAVKADAALSLFKVDTQKITWAVLDSGIQRDHLAFTTTKGSRVKKTLDFTRVRQLISTDNDTMDPAEWKRLLAETGLSEDDAKDRLRQLREDAGQQRPINWDVVEELLTLEQPPPPSSAHGTHVAGIIGAKKHDGASYGDGMCPSIQLWDFRVLARTIEDTEFAIIAALQYIRYVNERHNYVTIHGANLSLSIPHNVRNYACGRTPVCNECQRLVESGVVVVAAAGNRGYQRFETKDGLFENYAAFSITDPGNAEDVITVGATHGNWPHTYGVSFFSSRGPTGDGRLKPDLVAPGERIEAPVPGNNGASGAESGTSMAAPHVSGAAAMLMARYPELVGNPRRIKRILCESATDLGRERSFQGHGMLDVLRAFQSI